jgi:hypothetical protein
LTFGEVSFRKDPSETLCRLFKASFGFSTLSRGSCSFRLEDSPPQGSRAQLCYHSTPLVVPAKPVATCKNPATCQQISSPYPYAGSLQTAPPTGSAVFPQAGQSKPATWRSLGPRTRGGVRLSRPTLPLPGPSKRWAFRCGSWSTARVLLWAAEGDGQRLLRTGCHGWCSDG